MNITLPLRRGDKYEGNWKNAYLDSLMKFAECLKEIQKGIDFAMSSRGWCYAIEPYGLNKADFAWMQGQINKARRKGFLEPEFILEEEGHIVSLFNDDDWTAEEYVDDEYNIWQSAEEKFKNCDEEYCHSSFWKDKKYFIQILVEKSDLKSLFMKVCKKYRMPIANMRGWGSMEQKALMAKKFMEAEEQGKIPVLLACGDFDPPGLGISNALKNTFRKDSKFSGWDAENLVVERVGLNYDFIQKNKLTWIDGLTTINKKNLADPNHLFYQRNVYDIQGYIRDYGARKCEANAIVVVPELGRQLLIKVIEKYLGKDAYDKFIKKMQERRKEVKKLIDKKLEDEE